MAILLIISTLLFFFAIAIDYSDLGTLSVFLFFIWLFLLILKIFIGIFRPQKTKTIIVNQSNSIQKNKIIKHNNSKTSKLAIASFILSFFFFAPLFEFIAHILGDIAAIRISRSRGKLRGQRFAVSAVLISAIFLCWWGYSTFNPYARYVSEINAAIDYNHPVTRDFAVTVAKQYPGEMNFDQIIAIYKEIKGNWKYVSDPQGSEYFSPASRTIGLGLAGDCDDFAIVMAATMNAIGAETRIVLAQGEDNGHAYAEVNVKNVEEFLSHLQGQYSFFFIPLVWSVDYSPEDDGNWINLDWFVDRPGGEKFPSTEETYVYPNGKYFHRVKETSS